MPLAPTSTLPVGSVKESPGLILVGNRNASDTFSSRRMGKVWYSTASPSIVKRRLMCSLNWQMTSPGLDVSKCEQGKFQWANVNGKHRPLPLRPSLRLS